MRPRTTLLALVAVLALSSCVPGAHDHAAHDHDEAGYDHHGNPLSEELFYQDIVVDGIRVEFTIQTYLGVGGRGGHVITDVAAGSHAAAVVHLTDAETGEPVTGITPLAWIGAPTRDACAIDVQGYLSGSVARSAVVDLTDFFVLSLNDDPGISVIDPSVDVAGMTQLFAVIPLVAPGSHWAFEPTGQYAAVSIPSTGQVAVVDLEGFETMAHLVVGGTPGHIEIDPDSGRAWVMGTDDGISVIDMPAFVETFTVPVPGGATGAAFAAGRALVIGADDRALLVDASTGAVVDTVSFGGVPVGVVAGSDGFVVAFEDRLIGLSADGAITWEAAAPETIDVWADADGATVAAASASGFLSLLGSADGAALGSTFIGGRATDVAFVFDEVIALVPEREVLVRIDPSEPSAAPIDVAMGSTGLGTNLAIASERGAIVVPVPGQDQISLVPAFATAPAGSFQGHGLIPRSVAVVDRSLGEVTPGVFTGKFRVPDPGSYQLAVLIDEPRIVQCFDFEVSPSEVVIASNVPEVTIGEVTGEVADDPTTVSFTMVAEGAPEVVVMVTAVGGSWQDRLVAESLGGDEYRFTVTLPKQGAYQMFLQVPDLGLDFGDMPNFYLTAS